MSYYAQRTREERYQIYALKTARHDQVEIAKVLGVGDEFIVKVLAKTNVDIGAAYNYKVLLKEASYSKYLPLILMSYAPRSGWF